MKFQFKLIVMGAVSYPLRYGNNVVLCEKLLNNLKI